MPSNCKPLAPCKVPPALTVLLPPLKFTAPPLAIRVLAPVLKLPPLLETLPTVSVSPLPVKPKLPPIMLTAEVFTI